MSPFLRYGQIVAIAAARRRAQTHCKYGHPFTEANTGRNTKTVNGKTYVMRYCKACMRDRWRANYAKGKRQ